MKSARNTEGPARPVISAENDRKMQDGPAASETATQGAPPQETRRSARSGPVDIRLTIPLLRWRFYVAFVGGRERRGEDRLALERRLHPVRTRGNLLFAVGCAMAVYLIALGVHLLQGG